MQENSKTGKYIKNMYLQAIFKGKLLLQKKKDRKVCYINIYDKYVI